MGGIASIFIAFGTMLQATSDDAPIDWNRTAAEVTVGVTILAAASKKKDGSGYTGDHFGRNQFFSSFRIWKLMRNLGLSKGEGGGLIDGGWRMEDGGWRMEDGGWRMEDRRRRDASANCEGLAIG